MMNPVPKGAMELASGEARAPALPDGVSAAASEDSLLPQAETPITAHRKSVTLELFRLKVFGPTVGGFIPLRVQKRTLIRMIRRRKRCGD